MAYGEKKSGEIPGMGKFVVLHDGSILVLDTQSDSDRDTLHKLDNPSGKVISVDMPKKTGE